MAATQGREIHLREYPIGVPTPHHFEIVTVPVPDPGPGECLVRNVWMSVDPYMRGRMRAGPNFVPGFDLGKPLEGACIGQVIASNNGPFAVGDYLLAEKGWREYWLTSGDVGTKIDPSLAPVEAYLGPLGMPGMTAYVGLLRIGLIQPGETVYISGAAGAVGSVACQIAKLKGCRVIASAGSDEKVAWLKEEAGVDHAFNYRKVSNLNDELRTSCPQGINVYFDNVGGEQLDAALRNMAMFGRVVACGMISLYNAESPPPGPPSIFRVVTARLRIEGFIVFDHEDMRPAFLADMSKWLRGGQIRSKQTVYDGLENAPKAFLGLFKGENFGKMLVKLA